MVLYKHSARCPTSDDAYNEVRKFVRARTDVPVYMVDVIGDRPLSQYIAERTAIVHHSPQVLLVRGGVCHWHASHYYVTAEALAREVEALGQPGALPA